MKRLVTAFIGGHPITQETYPEMVLEAITDHPDDAVAVIQSLLREVTEHREQWRRLNDDSVPALSQLTALIERGH